MDKKQLLDNWSESGNNLDEFCRLLREISSVTTTVRTKGTDLVLYSKNEHIAPDTAKSPVYILSPLNVWDVDKAGNLSLKCGNLQREKFEAISADLLAEYENKTKLMLRLNKQTYFTSINLASTLGLRTEMKGESALIPSLARDVLTAERLNYAGDITFITRTINGMRKVFAGMSGTYAYVPQSFLCDIINKVKEESALGTIECRHWNIDNQLAQVWLEFPEKASEIAALYEYKDEIVPGLYLSKSDVGECSITIRATWRINNSIIVADEVKRQHRGKVHLKNIIEDADKIVFSKYTKLPEMLCELMATDITNPVWEKLPTKKFLSINEKAVKEAFKKVLRNIDLTAAIGKKNEKSVYEQLCDEIDPARRYTAYDIVIAVMQLPERLKGLSSTYDSPLAKACGKAPYTKFDEPEEPKVVLTA